MDKTIHWNPELQKRQSELLDSLPEDKREDMAFTFRYGNVCCYYYKEQESDPDEDDFNDWINGLPNVIAQNFLKDGFLKSKGVLPLRRHAAERRDIGLDAYMKLALSDSDFLRWSALKKGGSI